ncbi:MAG: hypothetical protein ABJN72_05390 [Sulfitobacter sp.]
MSSSLTVKNLAIAGLIGELSFEAYAWLVSPLIFGVTLEPAKLVTGLTKMATGVLLPYWGAFAIHFLIGAFGFAIFVALTHLVTRTKLIWSGVIAGVVLWFIAQGILAPVLGREFMMGFGSYTQSSFVGHVGMSALIAFVLVKLHAAMPRTAALQS